MVKKILFLFCFHTTISQSQTYDWTALTQTVNKPVECLTVYQNQLVAGGTFTFAGATQVKRIASWDGSTWYNLGAGIKAGPVPHVSKLITYNNDLYACGRFDSAGSVATKNIAKWDGNNWSGFGTITNGEIYTMAVYNGQLYAGGIFTVIGGVTAKNIAKWNGTQWQALGTGVNYGSSISSLCVYQNELYAAGIFDTIGNIPSQNIARWNGSSWNSVPISFPSGFGGLYVYQNKLLLGATNSTTAPYPVQIWQWDGANLSLFSQQTNAGGSSFLTTSTTKLYSASSSPNSPGKSTIWERNTVSSLWDSVGTNIQSVSSLCEYNNEIYCGGFFNSSNGAQANYIAKLSPVTGLKNNYCRTENISIYPNPANEILNIEVNSKDVSLLQLKLQNSLCQTIKDEVIVNQNVISINTSELQNGIYFVSIKITNHTIINKTIIVQH